jgi:aldehyde:ferredoxin oxidoreductase
MPYGYHDKILRVNLSTPEITMVEPGEAFFRMYLGGWGVIAHYLLKELTPGADPLGPDNLLIFAPGVVTGAPVGGSGRHAAGGKSPLTGGFAAAEAGGFWGAELKRAGWDGIVVSGQADEPVCLWINDDQVEIRDASHLWGKRTADVEAMLREELGDKRVRGPDDEIQRALELYDEINSWDKETGAPTPAKLLELGLSRVAELRYG